MHGGVHGEDRMLSGRSSADTAQTRGGDIIDIFMAGANSSTGILDALPLSLCNRSRKEIR